MNFSPDNRTTLSTLLAALGNGVTGAQGAPILQATLEAQAAQQQERTARYQQMAQDVTSLAGSGMNYGSVSNYVDSMTPQSGIPGRFQGLVDSAFQGADVPQSIASSGPAPGEAGFSNWSPSTMFQDQLQSPLYTQNPASTGAFNMNPGPNQGNLMTAPGQAQYAQVAAMAPPAEPSTSDEIGSVQSVINQAKNAGIPPEQIAAAIANQPAMIGIFLDNINTFQLSEPEIVRILAPGASGLL